MKENLQVGRCLMLKLPLPFFDSRVNSDIKIMDWNDYNHLQMNRISELNYPYVIDMLLNKPNQIYIY